MPTDTGERVTNDLDAALSHRIALPENLPAGRPQALEQAFTAITIDVNNALR